MNLLWGLVGDNSWLGSLYHHILVVCTTSDMSVKMWPQISVERAILMSVTKQTLLTLHTKEFSRDSTKRGELGELAASGERASKLCYTFRSHRQQLAPNVAEKIV